ncbi:AI-2E family transporter [Virgibacillus sp. 179-BFC.A HS]|uniref:AI-2E family transporter n=1 Tax=Tigheibacillus jepli TaxID=3035914 RepID=A0ABU5CGN3_9BACI|nr:AI-2E family transporter [Virgibacillus sp. 179-BFC.A HS]MDY0405493.1 AI-2E family transporter [Virgibacillus sp. 179-BFC.A HS]
MFSENKPLNFLLWVISGIFVFLFLYLLVKLFPFYKALLVFLLKLFTPFIISAIIAYLLYPIVKKMHAHRIPKAVSILCIYLVFFGGGAYLIYRVYPVFLTQVRDLNEQLPHLISLYESLIYKVYDSTSFLPEAVHDKIDVVIAKMETNIENITGKIIGGVTRIMDLIVLLTVIPVLVFYFLKDFSKMKGLIQQRIPGKYRKQTEHMVREIDKSLGSYIRGLLLVCLFVSVVTYIAFYFMGMKYPLLLAIILGLTNIIPYFGPIIGAVPACAIAITISTKLLIYVLIVVFAVQLIESNFISPFIVGKSVDVHPVAIIFALLLGGEVGGIIGMIVAVPIMTLLKVVIEHVMILRHAD